jgi:hypothetical protein
MNSTKNLIEPKLYMNPTKNLIETKLLHFNLSETEGPFGNKLGRNVYWKKSLFVLMIGRTQKKQRDHTL